MWKVLAVLIATPLLAAAGQIGDRPGWRVIETGLDHTTLRERLVAAVPEEGMGVVTQAGPTGMARERGVEIPENHVVGVFNNVYAVRILELSTAAMIEAPIRFYITEDDAGTITLSWKTPSHVFEPYFDEGGPELVTAAAELDEKFEAIAERALAGE
jgi:uncharacterized protein (DUF302 family)